MVARRWSGFDVPDDDVTNIIPRNMHHMLFQKAVELHPNQRNAMVEENPARAINVCHRIAMIHDFIDTIKKDAIEKYVPVSMPPSVGSLGFDPPLWVGLGMVGLWAALDAFAERANLKELKCNICGGMRCISSRFAPFTQGNEGQSLQELEDLRHLYAHNYAGDADAKYFGHKPRHVLKSGVVTTLTCGASFNGYQASLDLPHLRMYAQTVEGLLKRIS